MVKVTIGGDLAETFAGAQKEVLVCNEEGTTLGFFRPAISQDPRDYERVWQQISVEEMKRRAQEKGGITTVELMAKLANIPLKNPE